jgi:hypothetical protein
MSEHMRQDDLEGASDSHEESIHGTQEFDPVSGKIVKSTLSSEQARRLATLRWERVREAKEQGVADGAKVPTMPEGIRKVMANQTQIALGTSKQSVAAARLVLSEIQDERPGEKQEQEGLTLKLEVGKEVVADLVKAMELARSMRTDDIPTIDVE